MKSHLFHAVAFAAALSLAAHVAADDKAGKADRKQPAKQRAGEPTIEPAVLNLHNPCGIAVQPGTGRLFVSDSGALQVVRQLGKTHDVEVVIGGFPKDVYGKGPMYDIGPLGLAFLDENTLVVGGGGHVDGQELLRVYAVPEDGETLQADDMLQSLGPIGPGDASRMGEGNFYGLAVGKEGVYISSNGDDTKGWVLKADLKDGKLGELKPFIKTKVATEVDAPVGIVMNKKGQLVVGQMGEINIPTDSLLTIYDPASGEMLYNAPTGLYDIAALAYSPITGKLYALDFAWMDEKEGGLFRLDVKVKGDKMAVKAVKIVSLDKPAAMAFTPDGVLYVAEFGTGQEGASEKPGRVVEVQAQL